MFIYIPAVLAASEGDDATASVSPNRPVVEERSDYRTVLGAHLAARLGVSADHGLSLRAGMANGDGSVEPAATDAAAAMSALRRELARRGWEDLDTGGSMGMTRRAS